MKKTTFLLAALVSTFTLSAQTITQTVISEAIVTVDEFDVPTSWATTPGTLVITVSGYTAKAGTTVKFFNQLKNAAGEQIGGGGKDIVLDSNGDGSANFGMGFFSSNKLLANETGTWRTNEGTLETISNIPLTLSSLSSDNISKTKLENAFYDKKTEFIVFTGNDKGNFEIYDVLGKPVVNGKIKSEINISTLTSGVYILITEKGSLKFAK